jgi:signal transduction histidine kinase
VLAVIAGLVALIAVSDWSVGNKASLGILYIIPMMLGGIVLPIPGIAVLAIGCSLLRSAFDLPSPEVEVVLRFTFATLAYLAAGLFTAALIRNRELEGQLSILVDSSPAAILTIGEEGRVLAANRAANVLFVPPRDSIVGERIGGYLPVLADALQFESGPEGLRTAAQAQGQRGNGEIFLAHTWFSSYRTPEGRRVAAIVADSSEEMRDREELGLRQMKAANRIAAAGVYHEVRNLCGAISVMSVNLKAKPGLEQDEDVAALVSLAKGLEKVASVELQQHSSESLDEVELRSVLDDLRIVIEPNWHEIDGQVNWNIPPDPPRVLADRHGLLQTFLNLAHNSLRAVEECQVRKLWISVAKDEQKAIVRFVDSGTGVDHPELLFAPFQPGAGGSGLGLYVSRALVRSFGGDLRFEPQSSGAAFRVEIPLAL